MENKNGNGKQSDMCSCGCCGGGSGWMGHGGMWHGGHRHGVWFIVRLILLIILLSIVFGAGVKLGELRAAFGGYGWSGYGMMGSPYYYDNTGQGYYMGPGMMRLYGGVPQATGTTPTGR